MGLLKFGLAQKWVCSNLGWLKFGCSNLAHSNMSCSKMGWNRNFSWWWNCCWNFWPILMLFQFSPEYVSLLAFFNLENHQNGPKISLLVKKVSNYIPKYFFHIFDSKWLTVPVGYICHEVVSSTCRSSSRGCRTMTTILRAHTHKRTTYIHASSLRRCMRILLGNVR